MRDDSLPSTAPSFVCAAVLDKLTRFSKVVKTKLHQELCQVHLNNNVMLLAKTLSFSYSRYLAIQILHVAML